MCDINDAIKEGDGKCLTRLYKVGGCTKYAYITPLLLVKVNALLTEMKADQVVNNRFFNTHGNKGKNIPLDLKMEQLNNLLKAMLKILGSNLNEKSTHRIARSISYTELILASLDSDCMVGETGHHRSLKDTEEAVKQIVTDLFSEEALQRVIRHFLTSTAIFWLPLTTGKCTRGLQTSLSYGKKCTRVDIKLY